MKNILITLASVASGFTVSKSTADLFDAASSLAEMQGLNVYDEASMALVNGKEDGYYPTSE